MFNFLRKRKQPKVFVIGLDCAAPEPVFDTWRDQLPNPRQLMERRVYGELMSSIHAENGMFILTDPRVEGGGRRVAARQLMDIAPSILEAFGLPIPLDMQGRAIGS
jgi:predicted AlkP superfamily phosphohydrolase/phosphomutase